TEWVVGEREADYTLDPAKVAAELQRVRPAIVLLASPNNPTGTALPLNVIDAIATDARSSGPEGKASIVVVDEAYAEVRREGTPSALELLEKHPHLAVSRTRSEALGFSGVRLGYLAGSSAIIDVLRIVRLPYHMFDV